MLLGLEWHPRDRSKVNKARNLVCFDGQHGSKVQRQTVLLPTRGKNLSVADELQLVRLVASFDRGIQMVLPQLEPRIAELLRFESYDVL